MNLTEKQLNTLRHMLGINTPYDKRPQSYRDYAAVVPGNPEYLELEALGAIERYTPQIPSEHHYYHCTTEGKAAAFESHSTIRKSRAQRRYAAYQSATEVCPDLSFHEFLIHPDFQDARDVA